MRKVKRRRIRSAAIAFFFVLAAFLSQGCAYSHIQRPLDTDFDETRLGSKMGRAHSHSVLWLVAWGDAGTHAAAKEGDITVINHADMEVTVVFFGLYTRVSTVVYGD